MQNVIKNVTLSLMLITGVTFCADSCDDVIFAGRVSVCDEYIAMAAAGCLYESIVLMDMHAGFQEWQEHLQNVSPEEREEFNLLKEVFNVRFALDDFADFCDLTHSVSNSAIQVTLLELFSVHIPNPTVINFFIALGCDFSAQKNLVLKQITQKLKRSGSDLCAQDRQNMIECRFLLGAI